MRGELPGFGSGNSFSPVPSGFIRPMRLPALSVNHSVPSGASAMVVGPLPGLGNGNSGEHAVGLQAPVSGSEPSLLSRGKRGHKQYP